MVLSLQKLSQHLLLMISSNLSKSVLLLKKSTVALHSCQRRLLFFFFLFFLSTRSKESPSGRWTQHWPSRYVAGNTYNICAEVQGVQNSTAVVFKLFTQPQRLWRTPTALKMCSINLHQHHLCANLYHEQHKKEYGTSVNGIKTH